MAKQQAFDKVDYINQNERYSQDIQKALSTSVEEARCSITLGIVQVIRLFYALKQLDDAKDYLTSPLTNSLYILDRFRSRLFEVAQAAESMDEDDGIRSLHELFSMVHNLAKKCTDNIAEDSDITYETIYKMLDNITNPSAIVELKDDPSITEISQQSIPNEKSMSGTAYNERVSERSISPKQIPVATSDSYATVEDRFNDISIVDSSIPEMSFEDMFEQESKLDSNTKSHLSFKGQTPSASINHVNYGCEVASQTNTMMGAESSSLPEGATIPPTILPMPMHLMPEPKLIPPAWTRLPIYPTDPRVVMPYGQPILPNIYINELDRSINKEHDKIASSHQFSYTTGSSMQENCGFHAQPIFKKSNRYYRESRRQLGVIYEDEDEDEDEDREKDYNSSSHSETHRDRADNVLYALEWTYLMGLNGQSSQSRDIASSIKEGASTGDQRGVQSISEDRKRQQSIESTKFEQNKKILSENSNSSGIHGRKCKKKKKRVRSFQEEMHGQSQGTTLSKWPIESFNQSCTSSQQLMQQQTNNGINHSMQWQEHLVPFPFRRGPFNQQNLQHEGHIPQQQYFYQRVHQYIQPSICHNPREWYCPGYDIGAPIYYAHGQQKPLGCQEQHK
ncbi:hypothetical protein FBU30_004660 [Linnemannia zychae]|nr:hypothetical protein FBU30_004660 [Linnemannia zychae]